MDTFRNMRNDKLAKAMINKLAARNMEGFYVQTKEEAKELALSRIPVGSSVGWGGSMTVKATGLLDAVIKGNYKELNRDTAKTPEEKQQYKDERKAITEHITPLRKKLKQAVQIYNKSPRLIDLLDKEYQIERKTYERTK